MSNQPSLNDPNLEDYCFLPSPTPNEYSQQILQETFAAQPQNLKVHSREGGSELPTVAQVKMSERHRRVEQLLVEKVSAVEGSAGEGSSRKKLDHNAKERMRRMRLNASYLAIRTLLPDSSRRSKKRWTAPAILDRVLKYIPELENEIENLKHSKDNAKNKQEQQQQLLNQEPQSLTVSINEVQNGEAIIQICKEGHGNEVFSRFLENMEAEDVCIKTAATHSICDNRVCYQLHIQRSASVQGAGYIRKLRDKVIYWLR